MAFDVKRWRAPHELTCRECGVTTSRWMASDLPNACREMWESRKMFGAADCIFYSFWGQEFLVSFPDCGHQQRRSDVAAGMNVPDLTKAIFHARNG